MDQYPVPRGEAASPFTAVELVILVQCILYSRARQFTLIKLHSTEEYKLVPVNV